MASGFVYGDVFAVNDDLDEFGLIIHKIRQDDASRNGDDPRSARQYFPIIKLAPGETRETSIVCGCEKITISTSSIRLNVDKSLDDIQLVDILINGQSLLAKYTLQVITIRLISNQSRGGGVLFGSAKRGDKITLVTKNLSKVNQEVDVRLNIGR